MDVPLPFLFLPLLSVTCYFINIAVLKYKKNTLFGLTLICLVSSIPLFVDYLYAGHDLGYHLLRIEGLHEGLKNAMFPVKLHPNVLHEYGYASPVMYGDLFLYVPALLRIFSYTITDAHKIYIFLINITTCSVSYWCIKRIFNNEYTGLIRSALYTLSSYCFTNIYVKAAVGEYTAMAFFPLIFCGLYLVITKKETESPQDGIGLTVIGISCVIHSHIITCFMVAVFILFSCVFLWKKVIKKRRFQYYAELSFCPFLSTYGGLFRFLTTERKILLLIIVTMDIYKPVELLLPSY